MKHLKTSIFIIVVLIVSSFVFSNTNSIQASSALQDEGSYPIANACYSDLLGFNDTIIWETTHSPSTLDPHRNYDYVGNWILSNVYETLFTCSFDSPDATPVPLLAELVEISDDGLNYTFTLKEGVFFHDGTEFNATCVEYNLKRVLAIFDPWGPAWELGETLLGALPIQWAVFEYGPGSEQHRLAFDTWNETSQCIIVLNQFEIRIRLEKHFIPFLSMLAFPVCSMISPTWIEANGGIKLGESNEFVDIHACGTGPYELEEWVVGDNIILSQNNNYWRETDVKTVNPFAGSIRTVVLRDNQDDATRKLNLLLGDTDGCFWPRQDALEIMDLETGLSTNPDISIYSNDLTYTILNLGFNLRDQIGQSGEMRLNPFVNIDFRKACSYAYDYVNYIDTAFSSLAIDGLGPIPTGMFGYDDTLYNYYNDIELAVDAWNRAMQSGLDQILVDLNYKLELYYTEQSSMQPDAYSHMEQAINSILAHERAIQPSQPLSVSAVSVSLSEYIEYRNNGQLPIVMAGWASDYCDPDDYVVPFCKSNTAFANFIGYENSEVDSWIETATQTDDEVQRIQLYSQIQHAVVDHVAYIWLAQLRNFHVESSNLHGYVFNPMLYGESAGNGGPYFYYYWKELPSVVSSIKKSEWWRKEFNALYSGTPMTYNETYLQILVDRISRSSNTFADVTTFSQALAILSLDGTNGVEGLARRELFTFWLNLANRALTADSAMDFGQLSNAKTVRGALLECEEIMNNPDATIQYYTRIVRICLKVNTQK
ncbi:MAG: ABC transporter substrate-binding protein [Candidatus Thorarchaeota archaeon]